MNLPELGVGLNWFPDLDPVLKENNELLDVLEVEPQSLWRRASDTDGLVLDQVSLEALRQLRKPILAHSVALPIGGVHLAPSKGLSNLSTTAQALSSPWVSEHLSFNRIVDESGEWQSGFLLPPRQTIAGVEAAVASVRALSAGLAVPLAIETGVNYLGPRSDE